jgi:hypothetical protein
MISAKFVVKLVPSAVHPLKSYVRKTQGQCRPSCCTSYLGTPTGKTPTNFATKTMDIEERNIRDNTYNRIQILNAPST